jgi:ABC-type polysaccharide/polyol phosphate export permease
MFKNVIKDALLDLKEMLRLRQAFIYLAFLDLAKRFRRTKLGFFWLSLGITIQIIVLGFVFGSFKSNGNFETFFPYLSIGLIFFTFINDTIIQSLNVFKKNSDFILSVPLPFSLYVAQIVFYNLVILVHNLFIVVFIGLPLFFDFNVNLFNFEFFGLILFFLLISIFIFFLCIIISIISSRYHDFNNLIPALLRILFFLSPILWVEESFTNSDFFFLLQINPLYHLLGLIRSLIDFDINYPFNLIYVIFCLIFCVCIGTFFLGKYRKRISSWL